MLFAVFAAWLVVANRFSMFDRLAMEAKYCRGRGDDLAGCPADSPIHSPPRKFAWVCLTAWAIFSFLYRVICLFFERLSSWHGAWQGFCGRDGAVPDCGDGRVDRWSRVRVRASHSGSRENHQLT